MSLHSGHRNRVRERFLAEGLDGFNEHQVLEMLLFYCCPRKDTNALAHRLIAEFGSFVRVLEAPVKELKKIPEIGPNASTFISFAAAFSRYYMVCRAKEQGNILHTVDDCGRYLQPFFLGRTNEVVYILCLDAKCKVLSCKMVGEGSVNSAGVPIRKLVEIALGSNATSVILAHNHPSGLAIPSGEDVVTTERVSAAMRSVDIILSDHIVFSDNDYVSMAQSRYFDPKISYTSIQ